MSAFVCDHACCTLQLPHDHLHSPEACDKPACRASTAATWNGIRPDADVLRLIESNVFP